MGPFSNEHLQHGKPFIYAGLRDDAQLTLYETPARVIRDPPRFPVTFADYSRSQLSLKSVDSERESHVAVSWLTNAFFWAIRSSASVPKGNRSGGLAALTN